MDTFDRMIALAGMTLAAIVVIAAGWFVLALFLSAGQYIEAVLR